MGRLQPFYFPQTLAFKKRFCKLANQTPHCCALVELLQQKRSFQVPESWGSLWVSWCMWHTEQPQTCTKVQDGKSHRWKKNLSPEPFFSVNKLVRAHWRLLRQVVLQELTRMWDIWKLQPCWMLIQPPLLTDHCAVLLYRWCLHDVEWPLGTTLTFQSLA